MEASADYAAGIRFTDVNHVVAGVAEPPGPAELRELTDAILRGVFDGDLAFALQRAAAFCRVVAAGRADRADTTDARRTATAGGAAQTRRAASMLTTGRGSRGLRPPLARRRTALTGRLRSGTRLVGEQRRGGAGLQSDVRRAAVAPGPK